MLIPANINKITIVITNATIVIPLVFFILSILSFVFYSFILYALFSVPSPGFSVFSLRLEFKVITGRKVAV